MSGDTFTLVTRQRGVVAAMGEYASADDAMAAASTTSRWEPFGIRDAGDGHPAYWLASSFTAGEDPVEVAIMREPSLPSAALLAARHRAVYDSLAAEYAQRAPMHAPAVEERAERLLRFATGTSVLDPGCGTGQALAVLAGHGLTTTGCDISPGMAPIARAASPTSRIITGDFMTAGLGVHDIIWESALLHLYPAALEGAVFARFRELLAPGGVLSVSTTASEASSEGWESKRDYRTAARRYRRHFTEPELSGAFTANGFTVLDMLRLEDPSGKRWFAITGRKEPA
jgi:SAM-dependent methyltransferase